MIPSILLYNSDPGFSPRSINSFQASFNESQPALIINIETPIPPIESNQATLNKTPPATVNKATTAVKESTL